MMPLLRRWFEKVGSGDMASEKGNSGYWLPDKLGLDIITFWKVSLKTLLLPEIPFSMLAVIEERPEVPGAVLLAPVAFLPKQRR